MRMHTLVCSAPQKHNLQPFVLMVTSFYIHLFLSPFLLAALDEHTFNTLAGKFSILTYMDIAHQFEYDRARIIRKFIQLFTVASLFTRFDSSDVH